MEQGLPAAVGRIQSLGDARGFGRLIDEMSEHWRGRAIDAVVGIEARGFIIGPALALNLHAGFIPVRKPAKLPWRTEEVTYDLARLMEPRVEPVSCSGFADAVIRHFGG